MSCIKYSDTIPLSISDEEKLIYAIEHTSNKKLMWCKIYYEVFKKYPLDAKKEYTRFD